MLNMNEQTPNNNSWHDVYASGPLKERRIRKHTQKLKKIGILDAPRNVRILDLACGGGEMLDILADVGFTDLTGLDVYQDTGETRPWKYVQGTATGLPFEGNSFDIVVCAHALHHLNSSEEVKLLMAQADACLKPEGKLIIIDHYDSVWLRVAFALLESPLAMITSWGRDFRKQLILEHEVLYKYLDNYKEINTIIHSTPLRNKIFRKSLFFFFLSGEKA